MSVYTLWTFARYRWSWKTQRYTHTHTERERERERTETICFVAFFTERIPTSFLSTEKIYRSAVDRLVGENKIVLFMKVWNFTSYDRWLGLILKRNLS